MSRQKGRPLKEGDVIHLHLHFRLRRGEDDDLLGFLEQIPLGRRVAAIKTALRRGGMKIALLEQDTAPEDELAVALNDMLM